jgi:hypothetical protein
MSDNFHVPAKGLITLKGSPALFFNKRGLFKNKAAAYFSVRGVWGALVDLQYSALLSIKK